MKAILVDICFFEAHFKIHYTKTFRLSYPIPLPTTVAGIFGAMLGIERMLVKDKLSNFYFGAKLLNPLKENFENFTFIQIGKRFNKWPPGIVPLQILSEPRYLIAMAGDDNEIHPCYLLIKKGCVFLPYGGQNDFFVKDIRILKISEVQQENVVENYAPKSMIEKTEVLNEKEAFLAILPVMHKFKNEQDPFYFAYKARLYLKNKIFVVNGIGLYELPKFFYPT